MEKKNSIWSQEIGDQLQRTFVHLLRQHTEQENAFHHFERKLSAWWDWFEIWYGDIKILFKKMMRNRLSVIGLILLIFFIIVAVAAPWLAPCQSTRDCYSVPRKSFSSTPEAPTVGYPFGTSGGNYDIYCGFVWGTRTAFRVGLRVTISIVFIGIIIGALSAYFGGLVDNVIMRFVDIFSDSVRRKATPTGAR